MKNNKEIKSLQQMWEENDRKPFKAESENRTIVNIVGVAHDKAYGWVDHADNVKTFCLTRDHWFDYKEPEKVPHWRAVKYSNGGYNASRYCLSSTLYATEELARRNNGCNFIKLAKELPPIHLAPTKEERKILDREG